MQIDLWHYLSMIVTTPITWLYLLLLVDRWRIARHRRILLLCTALPLILVVETVIYLVSDNTGLATSRIMLFDMLFSLLSLPLLAPWQHGRLLFLLITASSFFFISGLLVSLFPLPYGPVRLLLKLAFNALFLFLLHRYFRPCLSSLFEPRRGLWYELSSAPLLLLGVLLYSIRLRQGAQTTSVLTKPLSLLLMFLSVYVVFYCLLRNINSSNLLRRNNALLETHLENFRAEMDSSTALRARDEAFCQDISSILDRLSAQFAAHDESGILDSLDAIDGCIYAAQTAGSPTQFTGNTIIDSVLTDYAQRAAAADVSLSLHLRLPQGAAAPDMAGFAVVLSNGLENALNACLCLPPTQPRRIELTGDQCGQQFLFVLSNTYSGEVKFDPVTGCPTTPREGHGYGTQSIAAFAREHGAHLLFQAENGWFSLRLLL